MSSEHTDLPLTDVSHSHDCTCNETDEDTPVLDVRQVPHAIRHATVFGALHAIKPGASMVLVAPHDPRPLLAQIDALEKGAISVKYLVTDPGEFHLLLTRSA